MRQALRFCRNLVGLACLAPGIAQAHSFGTPYVLPVPFWMYVYGCAATLVVTFVLLGFFASAPAGAVAGPRIWEISAGKLGRTVGVWMLRLLQVGATACLLITIVSGLIGTADAMNNIGMTLFWVLFLLGFTYLTLVTGDLFALVNPWKLAVEGLEHAGLNLSVPRLRYPQALGCWLAFLFYVTLIWIELFVALKPFVLSITLLIYSAITFAGVALFGRATWFDRAELFSVFFRLIGKLAPVEYKPAEQGGSQSWQVRLRPPFTGVLNDRPEHIGLVLFVLFMLSSTTYDSIHETTFWVGLFWRNLLALLQPLWGADLGKAQSLLMDWYLVYRQAGLLVFPFLYLGLYVLVLAVVKVLTRTANSLHSLALDFCYSLLPIAFAYHFTHYFTFLIVQVQSLPWLLGDPFGLGWNLLGLGAAGEPPPLKMAVIWHTQVATLLAGHVVSVYLSHKMATRTFATQRAVVISQLPLLILMITYTLAGLWILSLPLAAE